MNSFDGMIKDKNEIIDIPNLKFRIDEMNNWIDFLDAEIVSYRRRLWRYFEDMVDVAHIMEKVMSEFGESRLQKLIDDYMENERHDVLKKQRKMAVSGNCNFEFVDLDSLFSNEK